MRTPHETETLLRRLELSVTRRLDGLLLGAHLGLLPGLGSEKGRKPGVPHRRRRPADGLGGYGTHRCPPRPRFDRRPGAGDLGPGRPVRQHGVRDRDGRETRPRPGRDRCRGLPHRATGQSDRRPAACRRWTCRRHSGTKAARWCTCRPGRAATPSAPCCATSPRPRARRSTHRRPGAPPALPGAPASGVGGRRGHAGHRPRSVAPPAPAAWFRRGRQRLPRHATRRVGAAAARTVRASRGAGRRGARPARARVA